MPSSNTYYCIYLVLFEHFWILKIVSGLRHFFNFQLPLIRHVHPTYKYTRMVMCHMKCKPLECYTTSTRGPGRNADGWAGGEGWSQPPPYPNHSLLLNIFNCERILNRLAILFWSYNKKLFIIIQLEMVEVYFFGSFF